MSRPGALRRIAVERPRLDCLKDKRGQSLVEFGACAFLTVMLLLAVVEFGRMVLVYTTVNNAARIGVRFAMVHGSDNSVATTAVQTVVNNYLSAAAIDTTSSTVTVSYPGYTPLACASGSNKPGCPVKVVVSYPYQTMVTYFPINVTLASQSEGVITF
jgi:Flp pilus assembly protein TadG